MDGISVAASITSIAAVGVNVSISLYSLATQINTASERITSISNDISITASVLQQIVELLQQKSSPAIFSLNGLETTLVAATACRRIFEQVEKDAKDASRQLRTCKRDWLGKVELSRTERLRWPFLHRRMDTLRNELQEAKGTLMLMLQISSLAVAKQMAEWYVF